MKKSIKKLLILLIRSTFKIRHTKPIDHFHEFVKNIWTIIYCTWYSIQFGDIFIEFRQPINRIQGAKYFKIGKNTIFGKMVVLTAWDKQEDLIYKPYVSIGNFCNFGDYLHLTCINRITIGNNVLTGRWVTITDNSHGKFVFEDLKVAPVKRSWTSKGPIIIEDNVWIGDKVTILPGVTIKEGSIIGANSVVTKDIPAFCVAVGNPAKIIKYTDHVYN